MAYDFSEDIKECISDLSSEVIIVKYTGVATEDDWGDSIKRTTTQSTEEAVVNDISGDEAWNTEGKFTSGDKVFFFPYDIDITEQNKEDYYIKYLNESYKIMVVLQPASNSTHQVKELRCKRK